MKEEYFQLYSNCILVNGKYNTAIYDLHRCNIIKLNKRIGEKIIPELMLNPITYVKRKYPEWQSGIDAYVEMFIKEEYGFFTDEPQNFPTMPLDYHSPFHLNTTIINFNLTVDYRNVIDELERLKCRFVQLIVEYDIDANKLSDVLGLLRERPFIFVEVILNSYDRGLISLLKIGQHNKFYYKIYGVQNEQMHEEHKSLLDIQKRRLKLIPFKLELYTPTRYGKENLINTLDFFLESNNFNTGLNKKIYIDEHGYFKNYINHSTKFGNINTHSVYDVLLNKDFTKAWGITNDNIEKCKDCIYRYACNSHSEILELDGKYYKKEDCNYNLEKDEWLSGEAYHLAIS